MTPKLLCEALIEEAKLSGVQVKTAEIVGMEISGKDVTALKVKVINFLSTLIFKLLVEHEKKWLIRMLGWSFLYGLEPSFN